MPDENYYKVGGSLEYQHPTYVVRKADADLYEGLKNGEFCYVLNSRQMGKSSLRVQMMKKLKEQGVKCASIDMTRIGSHVTQAEWYAGVISELLRGFSLSRKVNFSSWWRDREALPPLQRLRELIEDVLLVEFSQKLAIFVDEIDSIIKIKFKEDFFAFIRACYNQRVDNPDYNRLTFCLLGVATPSDLITDKNISTPFNIGRAIELTGFQLHEVQPLIQGLDRKANRPKVVIREVLEWTGGQPFLTQKLCKQILNWEKPILEGREAECVEELVRSRIIENWETQDEPEHLRTIRDRILWSQRKEQLLWLYLHILKTGEVRANDTPEQMELRLSGLVVKQQGKLRVYNRIYASVFNQSWVENLLAEADNNLVKVSAIESAIASLSLAPQQLLATIHTQQQAAFLGELMVNEKFIRIYQGDITQLVTDAIVSSDDTYIQMSGGVSRRILEVGGNEIYKETRDLVPTILGNVAVTTAGKLRAKKIFHGVVIDWRKETLPSAGIVRQVVHKSIGKANECGFTSLAFPLLGTGAGCFPAKVCWKVTLSQLISDLSHHNQSVTEVIIVLYEKRIIKELTLVNFLKKDWKVSVR
jgi:O-acetyl-ADP-ribose deacetylase (regulator of RNase III)